MVDSGSMATPRYLLIPALGMVLGFVFSFLVFLLK